MANVHRKVFYLSDRTGLTVETLGESLLTQFTGLTFEAITFGFINSMERTVRAVAQINETADSEGTPPLVFSTVVDDDMRELVMNSKGYCIDLFGAFIKPLEDELGIRSEHGDAGSAHRIKDYARYQARMDALNFAQTADDGLATNKYESADLILVGVSRSGKTPTCLYMAMQYGMKAANYPLTPEDMEGFDLPKELKQFKDKTFGLTIDPMQLQRIRSERRPNSRYASFDTCEQEVRWAEGLFRRGKIPFLNSTAISVEEISATILDKLGLMRHPL
ncbi:MAG: posphoenolpyruvate synthetase regulatory kinase/phosphorylase PpsR [Gammaproteobacteria bacterium]